MHALVVVPSSPLCPRRVQEKGAHMFGHTGINVRIATLNSPLARTRGSPRPGRLVPTADCRRLIRHLHNHELRTFRSTLCTRENLLQDR